MSPLHGQWVVATHTKIAVRSALLRSSFLRKIVVSYRDVDNGESRTESLWAEPLSDGLFKIKNLPFFAPGIAFEDIVRVRKNDASELIFDGVAERSGNKLFRIYLDQGLTASHPSVKPIFDMLRRLGCGWERAGDRLYAVDVPKDTSFEPVEHALYEADRAGFLEYEDALESPS